MVMLLWLLLLLMDTAPPKTKEKKKEEGSEGDEEEDEEEEEEEEDEDKDKENPPKIRDPEKHALSQEAGKWRKKFRAAEARIKRLEEDQHGGDEFRAVRVEAAFWRQLVVSEQRIGDHESAFDLMTARGFLDLVKVAEDGEITGMDEAFDKLLDHYPWLADEPLSDPPSDGELGRRTATPPKKKEDQSGLPSRGQLQDRFPALRRHGR